MNENKMTEKLLVLNIPQESQSLSSNEDLGDLNSYMTIKAAYAYFSPSPKFSLYLLQSPLIWLRKTETKQQQQKPAKEQQ